MDKSHRAKLPAGTRYLYEQDTAEIGEDFWTVNHSFVTALLGKCATIVHQ